jgi:hypothetical protein
LKKHQGLMFMFPYIFIIYIFDWKSNEMHMDCLCILYYTILALYVSGAICCHNQELKLQSTAVGTRDCYDVFGSWIVYWSRLRLGQPHT